MEESLRLLNREDKGSAALLRKVLKHRDQHGAAHACSFVLQFCCNQVSRLNIYGRESLGNSGDVRHEVRDGNLRKHTSDSLKDPAAQRLQQLSLQGRQVVSSCILCL